MSANNRTSSLISSQLPFFVREEHENFTRFIEAYYEFLEQQGGLLNRSKTIRSNQNVDEAIDEFAQHLYSQFMESIPDNIVTDKALLMKHIKDFYRARGTEKATRFLMNIMFAEDIEFYYPKKDVIRVSDGKWYIERSLRIKNTKVDNISDNSLAALEKYIGARVVGTVSGAAALVEKTDRYYEYGTQIDEIILSNIDGDFKNGETVTALVDGPESQQTVQSDVFGGVVNSVKIVNPGSQYVVGDSAVVVSNSGTGAVVTVASVTSGNVSSIVIMDSGAGYRSGDKLLFTGGGLGSGANAYIDTVNSDSSMHPNNYNIWTTTISVEANTPIGNTVYSNLNSTNANSSIVSALSGYQYSNTGPAATVFLINAGSNYTERPTISVVANTTIRSLGIVGKLDIIDGGSNYRVGNLIKIDNVPGGYGCGANASVTAVGAANTITAVKIQPMTGHITGGSGYDMDYLPIATVSSNTGNGANIAVTALLGYGADFLSANSSIGEIQRLVVTNGGFDYTDPPTIDLSGSGDGTATAVVTIVDGVHEAPGRYLNDDGHISSFNFIQDRDYYQNFSYVVKVRQSINKYRQAMKQLTHPAGTKLFGEYLTEEVIGITTRQTSGHANSTIVVSKPYFKYQGATFSNTINISYQSSPYIAGDKVYIEYTANTAEKTTQNVTDGIYTITIATPYWLRIVQKYSDNSPVPFTGNLLISKITT